MTGEERHTRQGCARGQRHGTLDREDVQPGDAPWARSGLGGEIQRGVLRRFSPERPLLAPGGPGCWCEGGPVGHHGDGPHPGTAHAERAALEAKTADLVARLTDEAALAAALRGVGVLVLVGRDRAPVWAGPHSTVPPGEIHWRATAPTVVDDFDPRRADA